MWKKLLFALLTLIMALPFAIYFGAPVLAERELKKYITKADTASFSHLDLDLWTGDLVIHNLYVADTSGNLAQKPLYAHIDRFGLKGFDIWKAFRSKEIEIDSIILGKGTLHLPLFPMGIKDSAVADTAKLKLPINGLTLKHLYIDSLGYKLYLNPKKAEDHLSGVVHVQADSLAIPLDSVTPLYYKQIGLSVKNIYAQPKKSVTYFTASELSFSSTKNQLQLDGFKMRHRISEQKYGRHFGFDKTYIKLDVPRVLISGLPRHVRGISKQGLHINRIQVFAAQAYMYKDKRLRHPMTEKKFIVDGLSTVKMPIRVDTTDVTDAQLFFNENWREDFVPGHVDITDMKVRMLNLSNKGPTEKGKWTTLKAKLTLYNELDLDINWKFDLRTKGDAFVIDIKIGEAKWATLNPFMENTVGARFKKGKITGGRLLAEGNKTNGAGSLELYYEDMKVQFLDHQDHHRNIIHWAEGGLANLAVRNNNKKGEKARIGICYAEPKKERAIFGYVLKLFFSGFQDIALTSNNASKVAARGMKYLPMPTQADEKQQVEEAKNERKKKREEKKVAKAVAKEARKERRKAKRESRTSTEAEAKI